MTLETLNKLVAEAIVKFPQAASVSADDDGDLMIFDNKGFYIGFIDTVKEAVVDRKQWSK